MWILTFDGKPTYWLNAEVAYTVGRKDTDIIVGNDASISRLHITFTCGLLIPNQPLFTTHPASQHVGTSSRIAAAVATPPPPSLVTFTDASKYGSRLQYQRSNSSDMVNVELVSGQAFTLPSGISKFVLLLGNHGFRLDALWSPVPVCMAAVEPELQTKLENHCARAGFYSVPTVQQCDLLLCSMIEPCPVVMGALCGSKPIVSPSYVDSVLQRLSIKVPPPDAAGRSSLPSRIHDFWTENFDFVTLDTFLPSSTRSTAFSGCTFVCFQNVLFQEVVQYIPLSGGTVTLDDSLKSSSDVGNFFTRHHRHIVLYAELAGFPFPQCVRVLAKERTMVLVEYRELLIAVLEGRKLQLPSFPSDVAGRCDSSSGRKTERNIYNVDSETDEHVESNKKTSNNVVKKKKKDRGESSLGAWRSRDQLDQNGVDTNHVANDDRALPQEEPLEVMAAKSLPPFPCFVPYAKSSGSSIFPLASSEDRVGVLAGKCFQKQFVPMQETIVEMEHVAAVSNTAVLTARRVIMVDDEDVIPDAAVGDASLPSFNVYDLQAHNRINRKNVRAGPAGKKATKGALPLPPTRAAPAPKSYRQEDLITDQNDIFGIDSLY